MKSKVILILALITLIFSTNLINQEAYILCEDDEFIEIVEPFNVIESCNI